MFVCAALHSLMQQKVGLLFIQKSFARWLHHRTKTKLCHTMNNNMRQVNLTALSMHYRLTLFDPRQTILEMATRAMKKKLINKSVGTYSRTNANLGNQRTVTNLTG
jgi:hypothetical protein